MKKLFLPIWMLLLATTFMGCEDDIDGQNEEEEVLTLESIKDITEELIVEIIEANFSKEFGGLKYEQGVFYEKVIADLEQCDLNEKLIHMHSNEVFDVDFKWDYKKSCSNAVNTYNDRFHNTHNDGSKMTTQTKHFKLDVDPMTSMSIAGNYEKEEYYYNHLTIRNFDILEGIGGDHPVQGSITLQGGNFLLDFDTGETIEEEINFKIRMNSTNIEDPRIDEMGTINKIEGGYEVRFENGSVYVI